MQSRVFSHLIKKEIRSTQLFFQHITFYSTLSPSPKNTMKKPILASPAVLIAAAFSSTCYTNHMLVSAFTPQSMRKHTTGQKQLHVMNLSSSAAPMKLEDEKDTNDIMPSFNSEMKPKVIATAVAKSFVPSPNGLCGIMAVKLIEENYVSTTATTSTPKIDGDQALISQTGMFGGASQKVTSKKSTEGMLYVSLSDTKLLHFRIQ